jgi:hypothetical protein
MLRTHPRRSVPRLQKVRGGRGPRSCDTIRAHVAPDVAPPSFLRERPLGVLRALRSFVDEAPELRPWSLKFKDAWLERRFQDAYFDTNIQYIRIATVLGAVTWAALGPLAPLVVQGGSLARDALNRYGLGAVS